MPAKESSNPNSTDDKNSTEHFVRLYGDLIFDLCDSILSNSFNTKSAYRTILKTIRRKRQFHKFSRFERSWILQITYEKLIQLHVKGGRKVSPEEQIQLDASENVNIRLKQFQTYFRRLRPTEQILLLLKDKYGIPYSEIASAMNIPEPSLKIQRQQALRALEEWLWNNK